MLEVQQVGDNSYIVYGSGTFAAKDALKAQGGRWDAARKAWKFQGSWASAPAALKALVSGSKTSSPRITSAVRSGKCRVRGCHNLALRSGYCRTCEHDEL